MSNLQQMPAEILDEIAKYLFRGFHRQDLETWSGQRARSAKYMKERLRKRRDIMSLSASCKRLRHALFGRWILNVLLVVSCQEDLDMVRSLSMTNKDTVK
jgi:hypothetical protein